jgi:UDPglucose 6-dehydrogenase
MRIGFYGLTHLGITYLSATVYKGFNVIGCDDDQVIKKIKSNNHIKEPYIFEVLKKNKKKIYLTSNISNLNKCDLIFFSFDTLIDEKGKSIDSFIKKKVNKLLSVLNKDKKLVILSQVTPGFTDSMQWNKNSLFYMVETLIFGQAFHRAINPERIIIGTAKDSSNLKFLKSFLNSFCKKIIITDYKSAEFTKICINIFLISSIFTSNHLANISKKINANWADIVKSLRLDKRIGKHAYLKPSIGLSGTNLIRDLNVVHSLSKKNHLSPKLMNYWIAEASNRKWIENQFQKIKEKNNRLNCLILGLSYKENTDSILNSVSIYFIKKFNIYKKCKFFCYDPVVKKINYKNIKFIKNKYLYKFEKDSKNVLLILTPWKEFLKLNEEFILRFDYVIDPYGLIKDNKKKIKKYISLI